MNPSPSRNSDRLLTDAIARDKVPWVGFFIALATALLLNGTVFYAIPWGISAEHSGKTWTPQNEVVLELVPPVEPEPPEHYVETNPESPSNKPNETRNFAARDQQSAQPEPAEELSPDNSPEIEGEEALSPHIVQLPEPTPAVAGGSIAATSEVSPQQVPLVVARPQAPQAPAYMQDDEAPQEGDGVATYSKPDEGEKLVEKPSEAKIVPLVNDMAQERERQEHGEMVPLTSMMTPSAQNGPRARPQIVPKTVQGPLRASPRGVNQTGALAIDANFSEFGDYLQQFFEAVGIKWNELNRYGQFAMQDARTKVIVTFYINREGQIEDLKTEYSSASKRAEWACVDAIKQPAPYGKWTADMTQVLGERQPVTITFYYR